MHKKTKISRKIGHVSGFKKNPVKTEPITNPNPGSPFQQPQNDIQISGWNVND
jgi:UDP-N-acetylenolpyruvoylglucosamine reductase